MMVAYVWEWVERSELMCATTKHYTEASMSANIVHDNSIGLAESDSEVKDIERQKWDTGGRTGRKINGILEE